MDRSAVKAIVDRELPRLARELGVDRWRITTNFNQKEISKDHIAECGTNLPYGKATLYFDPDEHESEAEVIDSLRHELLHVVLAPFDLVWQIIQKSLKDEAQVQAKAIWVFSCEQAVMNLERILGDPCKPRGSVDNDP